MDGSTFAIVAATFAGPIVAVLITLWYQQYSLSRQARMELFAVLMRHRRNNLATEYVSGLNMVPVHFHNKPKVLERYATLMATLSDLSWKTPERVPDLIDKANTDLAYLLSEMSKVVRTPVDQIQILKGAYSPQGWVDDADRTRNIQSRLLDVLENRSAIRVFAHLLPITPPSSGERPMPEDGSKPETPEQQPEVNPTV
ncbi:hypothetical protein SAMN05216456_2941 [Devosia crocina]|uniref:DUF6680 domain-containing protein n=1 Tax=Devosia crocina TaxID=429728 RepID=A0A1I7NS31_9HYPH|nr:DUF6680 family protein [Devosia crocina]SFV37473.1 hypothetical protein SAMN05216456_2941 [Devosia crocina]